MPRLNAPTETRVIACPECDSAGNVYERTGGGEAWAGDPDMPYHCQRCGATFEEYVERDRKPQVSGSEAGQTGLGRIMAEMTVEEFDAIVHGEGKA